MGIEWGAIAVGIVIGYRFVRKRFRGFRLGSGSEDRYDEDERPEREYVSRTVSRGMDDREYVYEKPRIRVSDAEFREINEAVLAGERALNSLREAKSRLNSARAWGVYDILGGGMISSFIKHSKMDDANEWLEQANYDLRRFAKELRDVPGEELYVQTGDLASTLDIYFDNFFSDFIVQNRINEARAEIDRLINRVQATVWDLKNRAMGR